MTSSVGYPIPYLMKYFLTNVTLLLAGGDHRTTIDLSVGSANKAKGLPGTCDSKIYHN